MVLGPADTLRVARIGALFLRHLVDQRGQSLAGTD
jgi:hypothetical protein